MTISLVIPAYNEEDYLAACLESVAKQTEMPDEVLVVDNNSTDGTADVARRYPFVRVVTETAQGQTPARNRGFTEAKYELIARIDADSRIDPNWVATAKKYMADHPNVMAMSGSAVFYNFPAKKLLTAIHYIVYYSIQRLIAGTPILWGADMIIRKSAAMQVIDECQRANDINEDIYLSLIMKKHGMKLANYYPLQASVSLQRGKYAPKDTIDYLKRWHKNYSVLGMPIRAALIYALKISVLLVALPAGAVYQLVHHRP